MTSANSLSVSVIIVNFNGFHFTRQCLESLFLFHNPNSLEVIVVDNNSTDGSHAELPKLFPTINFISLPTNKGFGAANNIGAEKAKGKLLFFVNNDTLFKQETIEKLASILLSKINYGIVGPKLLNEDGTFQLSFGSYPTIGKEFSARKISKNYFLELTEEVASDQPIEKDWLTGAAFMIKRNLFELVGGFDERYFMYFEDIDLCKITNKNGYKSLCIPSVSLTHLGGKSYEKQNAKIIYEYRRSQLRYYDKHNSFFQRTMVRIYIIFKFFPKLFNKTDHKLTEKIVKLVFATHN